MSPRSARRARGFYPLHVRLCASCLLVQLPAYVSGEDIFSDYAYFSSYSDSWVAHAKRYADAMIERLGLTVDSLVTEVASNDGYLLQHFLAAGIPVLGVEPAANVAEVGPSHGASAPRCSSSAPTTGGDIAERYGRADLVAANNVFAHVPGHPGLRRRAARAGQGHRPGHAGVPAPAAADRAAPVRHDLPRALLLPVAADRVARALATAGLRVVDVDELSTHGGSLRVHARPEETAGEPAEPVKEVLDAEEAAGLHTLAGHAGFAGAVLKIKSDLLDFLLAAASARAGRWPATAPRARATPC